MSNCPESWIEVELSEVAKVIRGITYKKEKSIEIPQDGFLPVIRATNITGTALIFEGLVYVPTNNISDEQILQPGDVVIASSSGSKEIVGKAGAFRGGDFIGSFGAFCSGIRPSLALSSEYFGYYFQTPSYRKSVSELSAGSNINNLKTGDLAAQRFPLPPRAEQTRIVAKLEELLSDLDAGVAELKAAQKKLAQYRQSLLKAAVEGALTAEWRKQNTPTETGAQLLQRILTERRSRWEAKQLAKFEEQNKSPPTDWQKKYPEPVQPDTTNLPTLPKGWVWASGEQLCEFITKGTTPPKGFDINGEKNVPFLRVTNLTDHGKLDLADEVFVSKKTHQGFLARSSVYPNDVLMNIVGPPLGQVAVVPSTFVEWNINQAIAIFRAVEGVLPWFICHYLLSPIAQQWLKARSKTTAGQTNLTLEVCRSLPFPLPPLNEQSSLLVNLDTAMSSITNQEHSIELSLKQSNAQRQNILRAAFAGQLVPQDPNDESASVLLERIRAERETQAVVKKSRVRKDAIA
ncbi:MAG: restriction endonuclease subunit S [Arenimonas sp.]